jgi:hypothetical protein
MTVASCISTIKIIGSNILEYIAYFVMVYLWLKVDMNNMYFKILIKMGVYVRIDHK